MIILPRELVSHIFKFGLRDSEFLNELEDKVAQMYWEKADNGMNWQSLPTKLVQRKLKSKLMGELVTKNLEGVYLFFDNLDEPSIEIFDYQLLWSSISKIEKKYNMDIVEMDDYSILIGGKIIYHYLNLESSY